MPVAEIPVKYSAPEGGWGWWIVVAYSVNNVSVYFQNTFVLRIEKKKILMRCLLTDDSHINSSSIRFTL